MAEKAGGDDEVTTGYDFNVFFKNCVYFTVTGLTLLLDLFGQFGFFVRFALSLLLVLFWDVWLHLNTVGMEEDVSVAVSPARRRVSEQVRPRAYRV